MVVSENNQLIFWLIICSSKELSNDEKNLVCLWVVKNAIFHSVVLVSPLEVKVYEKVNYNNDWDGSSYVSGFGGTNNLPDGIYFYILELDNEKPITGYIYLKNQ